MPVKLTQVQAELKVKEFNEEYELVSTYKTAKEPIDLKHKCGKVYTAGRFKSFFEGSNKCPVCYPSQSNASGRSTKAITEEVFLERLKTAVGDEYSYLSGYTNTVSKTTLLKHNTCGNEFLVAPKMFLGVKQTRCPECSNKNRGQYLIRENYLQEVLDSKPYGNEYKWLSEYNNDNKEKLEIHHSKCNKTYTVRPNDFQQGYRCPHCSTATVNSYNWELINNYLQQNNIQHETEKSFVDLINIKPLKFDFFLNDKVILEYDGEQHFSSNLAFSTSSYIDSKKRDQIKNKWIYEKDYYFVRIHYKLNEDTIKQILDELATKNRLSISTITKHGLFVYDGKNKITFNSKLYYTKINEEYFTEEPLL